MDIYAIIHVDIGEGSSYEPSIVAVARSYETACHVADLKHEELQREFEESFPNGKLNVSTEKDFIHAVDENCSHGWQFKIQKIIMDHSFTIV